MNDELITWMRRIVNYKYLNDKARFGTESVSGF